MGVYVFVGALAAFGLWCALWTVLGWMRPPKEPAMVCIWNRLRSWNLVTGRLLVVDDGLTQQERMDILRHGREIEFCGPEALPALLGMGAEER